MYTASPLAHLGLIALLIPILFKKETLTNAVTRPLSSFQLRATDDERRKGSNVELDHEGIVNLKPKDIAHALGFWISYLGNSI